MSWSACPLPACETVFDPFVRLNREFAKVIRRLSGRASSYRDVRVSLGDLELAEAQLAKKNRNILIVRFRNGRVYRLPVEKLRLPSRVVEATVDDLKHGIVLRLQDGATTDLSSGFVLYQCDPVYRAQHESRELSSKTVGARIRAIRLQSGRRINDVAAVANLAPSNYVRLEAGKHQPRIETLLKVAKALQVPVSDLLGDQ